MPSSTIQWNGSVLPTTYLSETQLEAQVPGSSVAASGFADVAVVNPAPGGGTSLPLVFSTAYATTVVSQRANDLVWDATHQLIYLSVPSLAATNGNTISILNPLTGTIQSSQFAGSEPDVLAISDDDQFLYAGIDGSSSVQRFTLPGLAPDINYLLGADGFLGPTFAWDLQVAPGLAHTTAVSRGIFASSPYSALGGMAVYDDATQRATIAHNYYDSLQWGSDATIYAINSEITSFDLYVLAANASGLIQNKDYPNEFSNFYISIHYDSGTKLLYTDDGYVINPTNGQHMGAFGAAGWMIPDSSSNSAFFLGQTQAQFGTQDFTIESLDLKTFAPVAEVVVPNVQGNPLHFIRWGTNGLAFNDDVGYVYVLNSPFVTAEGAKLLTPERYMRPVQNARPVRQVVPSLKVADRRSRRGSKARAQSDDSGVPNPVPAITALSPNLVAAGVNSFALTVTGTGFLSLSTVQWNGTQLPTEYVSSGELQAQVSASDVATAGSFSVSVVNPSPGGGVSSSLAFTAVSELSNPTPVIVSLSPNAVPAGSSGFTLVVNGFSYFTASSVVEWNGSPRPTSFYSSGQLQVQISAADVATPGYALITVSTPGPGGISNGAEFQILYEPTVVNQVTNDMVWDPLNQVIYVSVPGSATMHANQVCVLQPLTAAIVSCQAAGSEPDVLAISDDSQFLYVGEDGTGSVQRFILPGLTPDVRYTLGNYGTGEAYYALDLQAAPGAPHTTAVTKGVLNLSDPAVGGISIFDDSTPRPTSTPEDGYPGGGLFASIQWGSDATSLYAANSESTGYDFYTLTVNSSGVVLNQDYSNVFWNPGRIHYDRKSGLVYSDDGFHAVNPATGLPAGIFEVGGGWPMAPDSTLNTVFVLARYTWQENSGYTIDLFDMTHYVPIAHIPFFTTQNGLNRLGRFIRWGSNGLAVNDTGGNIYLISGSFVRADLNSRTRMHRKSEPLR